MQVINQKADKQINHLVYGVVGTLLVTTLLSGLGLALSSVYATGSGVSGSKSNTASVTVANSCSMTASTSTEHSAILPSGVYSGGSDYYPNGIGSTTIETICNDPDGFDIYAIGFSGDNIFYRNTYLHNNDLSTDYDITTGTATSGTVSNWAMKLAAVSRTIGGKDLTPTVLSDTSGSFASYHAVPSNYTKVVEYSSNTGATTGEGSAITTTYAAYIAGNQPAGTYVGKVKYTLVHPTSAPNPTNYQMQNVNTWATELNVGDEIVVTDNRDGNEYTVARLCTAYTNNNCTESQIWMTQNLDFIASPTVPLTSSNTDLNTAYATDGTTLLDGYTTDGTTITWTPGSTLASPATLAGTPVAGDNASFVSGWASSGIYPHQAEGKDRTTDEDIYIYTSGDTNDDIIYGSFADCKVIHTESDCKHYKIGNYYNWTASVAMNNTSLYGTDEGDIAGDMYVMPNSICPKGWRLPNGITDSNNDGTGDTMSDFNKIFLVNGITNSETHDNTKNWVNVGFTTNGFNNVRSTSVNAKDNNVPLYFVRSGSVDELALNSVATYGFAWSSTVKSSDRGYYLTFHSGVLGPASQGHRRLGYPVRCLAR